MMMMPLRHDYKDAYVWTVWMFDYVWSRSMWYIDSYIFIYRHLSTRMMLSTYHGGKTALVECVCVFNKLLSHIACECRILHKRCIYFRISIHAHSMDVFSYESMVCKKDLASVFASVMIFSLSVYACRHGWCVHIHIINCTNALFVMFTKDQCIYAHISEYELLCVALCTASFKQK